MGPSTQLSPAQTLRCWAVVDRHHAGRVRVEQFLTGVAWLWKHRFAADGEPMPNPGAFMGRPA